MWMIWLDSVWNSAKLLSSTFGIANMTWLNSGICWRMWLAEGVWYDYNWCYGSGPVMCTAKEVAYLLMWRLFSIPMLHLTWLDKTVPSYVKCIPVYWHECGWYNLTRFNSAELLSSTCRATNISVAMMDSTSPKFCINFQGSSAP